MVMKAKSTFNATVEGHKVTIKKGEVYGEADPVMKKHKGKFEPLGSGNVVSMKGAAEGSSGAKGGKS